MHLNQYGSKFQIWLLNYHENLHTNSWPVICSNSITMTVITARGSMQTLKHSSCNKRSIIAILIHVP